MLNMFNSVKALREKLTDENNRARRFYDDEETKRKLEQPEVEKIIAKDKENRILLEQIRQNK
jgi:hypothetical protein